MVISQLGARAIQSSNIEEETGLEVTIKSYQCYQDSNLPPVQRFDHISMRPVLQAVENAIVKDPW